MAGKGVIANEVLSGIAGGAVLGLRWVCGSGVDSRSHVTDYGRDDHRDGGSCVGCRNLRIPGGSSDGGTLRVKGRALFVALALTLCLFGWVDMIWAGPVITTTQPGAYVTGSTGQEIVVNGSGYSDSQIIVNGVGITTNGSSTAVWGMVPNSALVSGGNVSVKVRNTGTGTDSNTLLVPVNATGDDGSSSESDSMLYVVAGLLAASGFIAGMGQRWS